MIPKLCIVIPGPTFELALEQVQKANLLADLLEFRIDLFKFSLEKLAKLRESAHLPVIFTFKNVSFEDKLKALSLHPKYIDIEYDIPPNEFETLSESVENIIISLHNFTNTPDLNSLFHQMNRGKKYIYKIATMANSSLDALRMLDFVRSQTESGYKIIGICMGELGSVTRILSPVFGNYFTYASLDSVSSTAPGQLSADILLEKYHYKKIGRSTAIFGLIGEHIQQSQSDIFHNKKIQELGVDAIYCKIQLKPEELDIFFSFARKFSIRGLSVTMPFKELVRKYTVKSDPISTNCGAINTLCFQSTGICGYNTDATGALKALTEVVNELKSKKVVLLGAGGVAKAIAYILSKQGCQLICLNRTLQKAKDLVNRFGGYADILESFPKIAKDGYDILINCTSVGMLHDQGPSIELESLLPNKIVMETIRRRETELVVAAKKKKCNIVFGETMFELQAEAQFTLFYQNGS